MTTARERLSIASGATALGVFVAFIAWTGLDIVIDGVLAIMRAREKLNRR